MTQEEKAKAYDEAIKIAKEINNEQRAQPFNVMTKVFPELKESEDEKIRKALINGVECCKASGWTNFGNNVDIDVVLAWLEKQGKKTPIDKIQLGKKYKCIASPRYSTFMTGKIYKPEDKFLCSLMNFCSDCFEPLEDGEQKPVLDFKASNFYVSKVDGKIHDMTYNPTDKVESRFKVKYAGSEYNVLEVKDIAGVTFYGIEDEPNHIDYVKAENCEIIGGYAIKENGSAYPTKPAE